MAYSTTPSSSATITINSSGYTSSDVSISSKMSLHNIDHATGCKKTTGLKRARGAYNSDAGIVVFDESSHDGSAATRAYLYIKNPNTTTKGTRKFTIYVNTKNSATLLCELYEGDFIYTPLAGNNGADILVHASDDTWFFEYMLIYENVAAAYIPGQEL